MLSDYFEHFCIMDKYTEADMFGAIVTHYVEGAPFMAGITSDSSTEARIAYRNGLKVMYTIVLPEGVNLRQDDVVKRLSDDMLLRVTSDCRDMHIPSVAEQQYSQVTAEVYKP